eukprot:PhF_6_TR23050/c0_g1_i1/m.32509
MLDNAPTLGGLDEASALANKLKQELELEYDAADWAPLAFDDPEISLFERAAGSLFVIMARTTFPFSAEKFLSTFATTDISVRAKFDDMVEEFKVLDKASTDDSLIVLYHRSKSPSMMISGRDFLLLRGIVTEGGVTKLFSHSINYKDNFPGKGAVRGFIRNMCRIVPKGDNQCYVETVSLMDPKGMIPTAIINKQKAGSGNRLQRVRDLLK